MRPNHELDHIDPNYPKDCDRPYQRVCGFSEPANLVERERSLNTKKSNRFLPWRLAKDEIGSMPVNPGDLCQFLDLETEEWVLEEFMGDWWLEKTRSLCGNSAAGKVQHEQKLGMFHPKYADKLKETSRKNGVINRDNKVGIFNPDNWQKILDGSAKENARRMRPVMVIDPQGKKHYHDSLNGAARSHGLSAGNLCGVLNGTRNHTKHYTAYYA